MQKLPKGATAIVVFLLIIIIDQIIKIWVKTHMYLGEQYVITDWFRIYFVENNGMAFGIEILGKMFLSLFRLIAVGFIGYYLFLLVKKDYPRGFIVCIAVIMAGAMGNIIDSVFYGEIFSASYPGHVATFVPMGEGYSSWLHGKVVDMFYFPIIQTTLPDWFPFGGGEEFVFFRPIFNFADAAISVGIVVLLIFYRKIFLSTMEKADDAA